MCHDTVDHGIEVEGLKQGTTTFTLTVSKMTGISRSSIAAYEVDRETPTYANLIKMAQILNASTDYLLGYETDKYIDLSGIDEKQREHINDLYNMLTASV